MRPMAEIGQGPPHIATGSGLLRCKIATLDEIAEQRIRRVEEIRIGGARPGAPIHTGRRLELGLDQGIEFGAAGADTHFPGQRFTCQPIVDDRRHLGIEIETSS
jgi:hypothetical protein